MDLSVWKEWKLDSKLIWFMFERDYSDWIVVIARVAAGRPVKAVPLGEMTVAESWWRDDGTECRREIDYVIVAQTIKWMAVSLTETGRAKVGIIWGKGKRRQLWKKVLVCPYQV